MPIREGVAVTVRWLLTTVVESEIDCQAEMTATSIY